MESYRVFDVAREKPVEGNLIRFCQRRRGGGRPGNLEKVSLPFVALRRLKQGMVGFSCPLDEALKRMEGLNFKLTMSGCLSQLLLLAQIQCVHRVSSRVEPA